MAVICAGERPVVLSGGNVLKRPRRVIAISMRLLPVLRTPEQARVSPGTISDEEYAFRPKKSPAAEGEVQLFPLGEKEEKGRTG